LFKEGEEWVRRLKVLMPSFTPARIDAIGGEISLAAAEHAAGWREGESYPDLMVEVSRLGARVVRRVGYDLRPDHPASAAFAEGLVGYQFATVRSDERFRLDELGPRPGRLRPLPRFVAGLLGPRRSMRTMERPAEELRRDLPLHDPA